MEFPAGAFDPVEAHIDDAVFALDLKLDLTVAEPHGSLAFARNASAIQLPGNAPLALAQNMVDCRGDSRKHLSRFAFRHLRMETTRKFLGNEAGGEFAGLPAGMRHQRREERDIVADAVDDKSVQCIALRGDRRGARRGVRYQLGDHRIIVE